MELINSFTVPEPVDRAWAVITDLERIAPCLPGAALLGVEGEDYRGAVTIKVGPVTAQYEGIARFVERDDEKQHAVIRAEGRDTRGQGNAAATIDLQVRPQGDGSEIVVVTDLELAGRVAQFGRGVIADVSGKVIGQFARRLEEEMGSRDLPPAAPAATTRSGPRGIDDVEPLDLLSTGGGAALTLLRSQAPAIGAALVALLLGWLVGRAGRRSTAVAPGAVLQLVLPGAGPTTMPTVPISPTIHLPGGDR